MKSKGFCEVCKKQIYNTEKNYRLNICSKCNSEPLNTYAGGLRIGGSEDYEFMPDYWQDATWMKPGVNLTYYIKGGDNL